MKSILYVGATLMIGASIYGFVDYQKTSRKKEFKNLYKETPVSDPAIVTDTKTTTPAVNEKITTTKKVINNDKKNTAVKPIAEDEKMKVAENKEIGTIAVTVTPSKEDIATKTVVHKKRRFSANLFSRAPLDERYIDKEIKIEEPKTKTGSGKIENKEQ
jgi:hypothetical protein